MKAASALTAAGLLLAGLMACSSSGDRKTGPEWEFEKSYTAGDASLSEKISRKKITAADSIKLVLEATAKEGVKIEFPAPTGKLGKFTVAGCDTSAPVLTGDNRILLRKSCTLEPFLPGDYQIPSLKVRFGEATEIATEPVGITVESVLSKDVRQTDIKEVVPPVDLPTPWWVYLLVAVVAAGAAVAGYLLWKRHRAARECKPAPLPHQVALAELKKLMAEDLIAKGQAKLFYLRLSAILRHYIEDRFSLRAPERTTEEFLADLRGSRVLTAPQKQLLKDFLEHCDMVKFAEFRPTREQIDDAVNSCAQFITETRLREAPGNGSGGGKNRNRKPDGGPATKRGKDVSV